MSASLGPSAPNIGTSGLMTSAPAVVSFAAVPTASCSSVDQVTANGTDLTEVARVDETRSWYPCPRSAIERSVNLATPFTAARVVVPVITAPLGLTARLTVTLSDTSRSCPAELRKETSSESGSVGRTAGGRSTRRTMAVVSAWPEDDVRGAVEAALLQAAPASAPAAPSANSSLIRFTTTSSAWETRFDDSPGQNSVRMRIQVEEGAERRQAHGAAARGAHCRQVDQVVAGAGGAALQRGGVSR